MSKTSPRRVTRRQVFYLPGYDPFHPRRYRELYRTESAAQASILNYKVQVSARRGGGRYGWHVASRIEGCEVETDVEVLVWHDIVKDSMDRSILATYLQMLRTAWVYLSTGALFRLMRLRKGPVIAALYPVGGLLAQAALARALVWLGGALAGLILPSPWSWGGALLGAGAGAALLVWFRRQDGRFFVHYLMHDYGYSAQHRGATPPALEARLAEFARIIDAALDGDADEVLIVGHSSGAHLAVSILADLDRAGRLTGRGPVLSFLSLGQVVPMVSFLPEAGPLRADLSRVSKRDSVTWIDVTAPGDGCAFALCDPVRVSGRAVPGTRWPLVLSCAFTRTLRPETWAKLRWRFFRLHFQYLCAFDGLEGRFDEYDYFRITAGPMTLGDRLGARAPSKSRKEAPVNGFPEAAP